MEQLSIEDEEEWAREQGVPSFEEPMIQRYLQGRDALSAQEKKQRSDHAFRETLSPMAAEACAIVSQIRYEEQQRIWTSEYENTLAGEGKEGDIYPGMMFQLARERMEQSKLFKIVKKIPKGALLHCHLEAMVNLDWLVEEMFREEGVHIEAEAPLSTGASRERTNFSFRYQKKPASSDASLWSEAYKPKQLIPVAQAADSFPEGGRDGFKAWFRSRVTITTDETLKHHHGPNDIWRKFTSCFGKLATLLYYEPIFRKFLQILFRDLLEDGVQYVDLRAAFVIPYYKQGSDTPEEGYADLIGALDEEIEKFKGSEEGKRFWGARLIWTGIRAFNTRQIIENMQECILVKTLYPHLIAGFDFVGQEDLGRPLADLTPELFWFKKACMQEGVDIPFFFHAGETLGDGSETDENLFDAVLLGTRRIGHGFSLYKHPLLIDMVKEKKILVESCPISNEVLRLTGSIMSHPLPALLARGVPVALCNDDPAILGQGNSGMTHDFWQALQGWENLGLEGLGSMAENSVRWATFHDCSAKEWVQEIKNGSFGQSIRAKRMKEWSHDWEKFCQWVVMEYGADVDLDLDPEE